MCEVQCNVCVVRHTGPGGDTPGPDILEMTSPARIGFRFRLRREQINNKSYKKNRIIN